MKCINLYTTTYYYGTYDNKLDDKHHHHLLTLDAKVVYIITLTIATD